MAFTCPACRKPLYNRLRDKCASCGAAIPENLRLTPARRDFLNRLKQDESRAHREFMERKLPGGDPGGPTPFSF
jgi:hypothetical protein